MMSASCGVTQGVGDTQASNKRGANDPFQNFKTLHDTCSKFQRIKMKFYILFMKILYSKSENLKKCSVCLRFDFVSRLSSEEERLHRFSKRQE